MATTGARIATHPIHPMLVVVPLGLWIAALAFDIVAAVTVNALWHTVAFWNIVGGTIGALVAAVPGFVDYRGLQELVLSVVGVGGVLVSGWLGGEMVYVERVGVEEPGDRREDRRRRVA
jgi:uncharacterized membrane protein